MSLKENAGGKLKIVLINTAFSHTNKRDLGYLDSSNMNVSENKHSCFLFKCFNTSIKGGGCLAVKEPAWQLGFQSSAV